METAYEKFDFHQGMLSLYQPIEDSDRLVVFKHVTHYVADLSASYFEITKDRLYNDAAKSRSRRSAQTTLHHVHHTIYYINSIDCDDVDFELLHIVGCPDCTSFGGRSLYIPCETTGAFQCFPTDMA
jgi:hypothetical protein